MGEQLRHSARRRRESNGEVAAATVSDGDTDDDMLHIHNAAQRLAGAARGLKRRRQRPAGMNGSAVRRGDREGIKTHGERRR